MANNQEIENDRAPTRRKGFTLVELLIALVLLNVGLFALVGIAATISRDASHSRSEANARSVASARLERAASLACRGSGSVVEDGRNGIVEWFSESDAPNATRLLGDSVVVATSSGARSFVLRTRAPC
ncbi:MAG TPA: prepilin-type N-terminal cleavage/methylation domain-containing protein [Gemmatimonadaceae bacterium]|nr:prepilin-type N-terminal cleavage/methylation domain-containing protein [Gemmatimonadaceae bacterium]